MGPAAAAGRVVALGPRLAATAAATAVAIMEDTVDTVVMVAATAVTVAHRHLLSRRAMAAPPGMPPVTTSCVRGRRLWA